MRLESTRSGPGTVCYCMIPTQTPPAEMFGLVSLEPLSVVHLSEDIAVLNTGGTQPATLALPDMSVSLADRTLAILLPVLTNPVHPLHGDGRPGVGDVLTGWPRRS